MGGNIKSAMTEEPKVTRECNTCGDEFETTTKYGGNRNCKECKEKYNDPKYLETSLDIEIVDTDTLKANIQFDSFWADIPIDISGDKTDDGYIYAYIRFESAEGSVWYEDVWFKEGPSRFGGDTRIRLEYDRSILWESDWDESFDKLTDTEKQYRSGEGHLLRDTDEIKVTVDFVDEEVDSCSTSITTAEFVAENI